MYELVALILVMFFGVTMGVGFYFGGILGEYLAKRIKQAMEK